MNDIQPSISLNTLRHSQEAWITYWLFRTKFQYVVCMVYSFTEYAVNLHFFSLSTSDKQVDFKQFVMINVMNGTHHVFKFSRLGIMIFPYTVVNAFPLSDTAQKCLFNQINLEPDMRH